MFPFDAGVADRHRRDMTPRPKTLNLCGLAAVGARWRTRPETIQRLFFDLATGRQIGAMTKALAAARKVYRCVEPAELEKVAGSVHHGGIVAVVDAPTWPAPRRADPARWAAERAPVLVLDRIGNAHNLGALARTAAFLGVKHLVIPDVPAAAKPNDAAYRVAEGGLEYLSIWIPRDLRALVQDLAAAGYAVAAAATRDGRDRVDAIRPDQPIALVLGNEEHGIDPALLRGCTHHLTLAGTGAVESLNVSVAGAILLDRLLRR